MAGLNILIIDTCGATGSIALADTTPIPAVLAAASLPGRTASERLIATIKELGATTGLGLPSLAAIAVVNGPGSFTGVRVGLSAAKGLCEAVNLPLIAISRLAVLAHLAQSPLCATVHAILDAGRGEFYSGVYMDGICLGEALLTGDELLAAVAATRGQTADRVVACEATVAQSLAILNPQLLAEPTAADALPLALLRLQGQDFDDVATIDANYLRRTDAQIFAKPRPRTVAGSVQAR
jgi:tRNA threonylcarbamoyladenosine biosynthesis protein TsaB